jgi:methyl-accepting chemotaxis protein
MFKQLISVLKPYAPGLFPDPPTKPNYPQEVYQYTTQAWGSHKDGNYVMGYIPHRDAPATPQVVIYLHGFAFGNPYYYDAHMQHAEKINSLVNHIQTAINSTVIVTDEGRKTTELGIKLSQETAEAFASVTEAINKFVLNSSTGVAEAIGNIVLKSSSGVVESINEDVLSNQQISMMAINDIVERSQQISLTDKQQAIAIQQVVEAMNSLNQGAQETANGISQTKVGIKNLNEAAQSLNTIV